MSIRDHLVDDWNQGHKWLSVQVAALISAAAIIFDQLPTIQQYVPQPWFNKAMAGLGILAIIGRLMKQGKKDAA